MTYNITTEHFCRFLRLASKWLMAVRSLNALDAPCNCPFADQHRTRRHNLGRFCTRFNYVVHFRNLVAGPI